MIEDKPIRSLYFTEQVGADGTQYVLWRGSDVVGVVTSRCEAELICRNNKAMRRMASERTNDLRRHQAEHQRTKQEIDALVGTLRKVTAVLKRGKEREMTAAKEEAGAILRKFNTVQGFTLVEALIAIALSFMLLTISASTISQGVRASRIKAASNQLTMDLRMARLTAVSKRIAVDFVVSGDPVNEYTYSDFRGRLRQVVMPHGVRIASSTTPIRFLPNGSVQGGGTTILEVALTSSILERRTITTNVLGVSTLTVNRTQS